MGWMKLVKFRVVEILWESENIVFFLEFEIMWDRYFEVF